MLIMVQVWYLTKRTKQQLKESAFYCHVEAYVTIKELVCNLLE